MTVTTGANRTVNTLPAGTVNNYGVTLGVQKSFANNKWQLGTTNAFTASRALAGNSTILNLGLQSSYQAGKHHVFSLRAAMTGNYPKGNVAGQQSFTETTGEAAYTLSF